MYLNAIVFGNFRSGTTLISNIINSHPEGYCISEGLIPFFKALQSELIEKVYKKNFEYKDLLSNYKKYPKLFDYLKNKKLFDLKISKKNLDKIKSEMIKLSYHNPSFENLKNFKEKKFNLLLIEILKLINKSSLKKTKKISIKVSWINEYIPALVDAFKKVKIIHIVRNPVDMINSAIKSKTGTNFYKGKRPLLHYISFWKNSVNIKYKVRKINYLFIKYEDLTSNRKKNENKIFSFLNLKKYKIKNLNDEFGREWLNNSSFSLQKKVKNKRYIKKDFQILIENLCKTEMTKLKYKFHKDYKDLEQKEIFKLLLLFDSKYFNYKIKKYQKYKNYKNYKKLLS